MMSNEQPIETSPRNSASAFRKFIDGVVKVGQKSATPNLNIIFGSHSVREITTEVIHNLSPSMDGRLHEAGQYLVNFGIGNTDRIFKKIKHILYPTNSGLQL